MKSSKMKKNKKQIVASRIRKTKRSSLKFLDQVLIKVSPQLQQKIDYLINTLESSKKTHVNQLSLLAGKILVRAQEVSQSLRKNKPKKSEKTKTKRKTNEK
jgi:hypothetical protein